MELGKYNNLPHYAVLGIRLTFTYGWMRVMEVAPLLGSLEERVSLYTGSWRSYSKKIRKVSSPY